MSMPSQTGITAEYICKAADSATFACEHNAKLNADFPALAIGMLTRMSGEGPSTELKHESLDVSFAEINIQAALNALATQSPTEGRDRTS
jgi:hypothetical protein